ncbi:barstar (barnase inhibitor) [Herbihabitans rhizosphaerae]|uniref:Barstar (Barnase inhibitor) n=1 Tax=Herbihabitans rhizosphaerae TaxID=1872711 RepID=A0A4Q7KT59_9PSEU|nr:barstar family protein [Herbihabitans rhizosphaerae]RZS38981.1 barstar (barnase inhibitor) [Herbihabitans rhizosphaerae]
MASFDPDAEPSQAIDFMLMRESFVVMFWDREVLATTTAWLTDHGYRIVTVHAGTWHTDADAHQDLAAALDFPDYYGRNLDAFNDCMRDVTAGRYGADLGMTGFVLVLRGYDRFVAREPETAHALLDIFADNARGGALIGHRMMCLVQSDDPQLEMPPVGATPVTWNPTEWLNSRRGNGSAL